MYETQIIGHLAHDNKLFDVQCTKCGIMYDNKTLNGSPGCPKCHSPLDSIRAKNNRAMAISEGTIYPTITEADKAQEAENVAKRKNAMPITHRFVIFSFADRETGVLQEPPVHQYLATGREIMIKAARSPIASWYQAKDKTIKLELRYVIMPSKGDKIQLLGRKEQIAASAATSPALGVNAPVTEMAGVTTPKMSAEDAATIAGLRAQLDAITKSQNAVDNQEPLAMEASVQQSLFPTDEDPFA